jgi:hypothetical protein
MPKPTKGYAVGRGKPPIHTRFQKGRSGNPSGRPRGSPNFYTSLEKALQETIVVTEQGHLKRMTKLTLGATRLVTKAAGGDHKALVTCAAILRELEQRAAKGPREFKIRVVPTTRDTEIEEPEDGPR